MSLLYPTLLRRRLADVTAEELRSLGTRAVLLDIDNTLTTHHSQIIPPETTAWLAARRADGFALLMVSNSKEQRVRPFAQAIGLPYICMACKPLPFGLRRAAKQLGFPPSACTAIGDQTFTDVLGARLSGMKCVQLLPIEPENKWSFRVRRRLEKGVLARFRKKEKDANG